MRLEGNESGVFTLPAIPSRRSRGQSQAPSRWVSLARGIEDAEQRCLDGEVVFADVVRDEIGTEMVDFNERSLDLLIGTAEENAANAADCLNLSG